MAIARAMAMDVEAPRVRGEAGTVVSLPARGRPPQAAARRAGLDRYGHLFPDEMAQLAARLDRAYEDSMADPARTRPVPEVVQKRKEAGQ